MKLLNAIIFSALVLLSTGCQKAEPVVAKTTIQTIQERGVLILGTSGNMAPMTRELKSGDVVGFDIDLAQLMADSLNVGLKIEVMPLDQLTDALENGKVDVVLSNLTATLDRNTHVAFVGPYLRSGKCLITKDPFLAKTDSNTTGKSIENKNNKIAVLKGSTSENMVKTLFKNARVVSVDNKDIGIDRVKSDEVVAMITDYPICLAAISENPDAGFISVFTKLTYEPISIAINGKDPLFLNWTQNFLIRVNDTGYLNLLGAKWFGQVVPES